MSQVATPPSKIPAKTRWLIWWIYFLGWTAGLLLPVPWQPAWHVEGVEIDLKFLATKGLHVAAYALLTILTGWLAAPVRWRWLLMFVLMAHGPLTERLQMHVPGRTGSLRDVLFDTAGISFGLLVSWKRWASVPADSDSTSAKE